MKLLALGDLHLGAGTDLGRQPYGPESRLADQTHVWLKACELAVVEDCALVLFAGDAFHRRRPSPSEILAFRTGLYELERHDIPVIAVDGNHDVVSADLPSALSIFEGELLLSRVPEIVSGEDMGVTIATLPWTPPARLVAQAGGGDRDSVHSEVAALLVDAARGLRAQCPADRPCILMAHWSVSGAALPNGQEVAFLREPVLSLGDLIAMQWDAVIVGHIHAHQILSEDPLVMYVGSPAVVDFSEARISHGIELLEVS